MANLKRSRGLVTRAVRARGRIGALKLLKEKLDEARETVAAYELAIRILPPSALKDYRVLPTEDRPNPLPSIDLPRNGYKARGLSSTGRQFYVAGTTKNDSQNVQIPVSFVEWCDSREDQTIVRERMETSGDFVEIRTGKIDAPVYGSFD